MMMQPSAPIYIVSKGRWDSRLTHRALSRLGVAHSLIVEEAEFDQYAAVIDPAQLLILPPEYQRDYETCDDLGLDKSTGPGPARNFAWDHALASGAEWHWVMDDNIRRFLRLNRNTRTPIGDGTPFAVMEEFVARYDNVAMAGPNYRFFVDQRAPNPPLILNTRIYSCNLIRNDVPFRWRGRYNEDTILSLDMLKAGWCTLQFNAFLQEKMRTQTMRGGNTDEFYAREGTLAKSRMLVEQHPDVARLVHKFGRPHHYVNYRPFQATTPRRKAGLVIPDGVNDHGLTLVRATPR